jgi:pimeloyl-ACP methyl ester carboxylesterase
MAADTGPRGGTVQVNGLRLHYLDWGNVDAPPMLLLHGTSSHAHIWDHFAAAFRHAFHIVALDQRGFGDSEWPPDHTRGYLQTFWASDVKGVIDALGFAPVVLIGLSTGGNNALHFTATHPEDIARLVIVEMGPEVQREGVDRVIRSIPAQEEFESAEAAIAYLTGSGGRADPVLARQHALHSLRRIDDGRVGLKGDPALRRRDWRRPLRTAVENWAAVHAIACPTLLVRGGESRLLSAEIAERMAQEMQDCSLVTIAGAGHSVPLHRPLEFEAAVGDWLGIEPRREPQPGNSPLSNQPAASRTVL